MATYGYVAIDSAGKQQKGSIECDDQESALAKLKSKNLVPVSVTEQGLMNRDISFDFGGKVNVKDVALFCRQFVSIAKAGVPIIESMHMLSEQTENKKLKQTIRAIKVDLEKGEMMAEAMSKYPKVFPSILISAVEAGEKSGSLELSFERMAVQFEKSAKVKAMIKKAMIYPIIVAVVAVAVLAVMLIKVIPTYVTMFEELGTELPAITKITVAMSDFVVANWYFLFAGIVVFVFVARWWAKTPAGQLTTGRILLKLPIIGNLQTKTACSLLSRTMSTMLASGINMMDAIEITANSMDNVLFYNALMDTKAAVAQGQPLSQPLEESGIFPPMLCNMIRIGEETGSAEEMLSKLAEYYDDEVEQATQALMAAMEPMIIIVLAGVVGFLIASILAPMVGMYEGLDNL